MDESKSIHECMYVKVTNFAERVCVCVVYAYVNCVC